MFVMNWFLTIGMRGFQSDNSSSTHLCTSHLGVMRKGGQYCSTRDLVVSISGNPLAIASLDRAYCFARYLQPVIKPLLPFLGVCFNCGCTMA